MSALRAERSRTPRIGYVVKVYPRFSETFVVTELLAREAAGETITVFALRPSDDPRFHPELARVAAPVRYLPRPTRPHGLWELLRSSAGDPFLADAIARHLPELLDAEADDAAQAVALAQQARAEGITHLHAHFASAATTVARLASLLTGVPYSFTAHAKDLFHESVDPVQLQRKIAGAAYIATVSAYNVGFLQRIAPEHADRIHLVPNAIEIERFPFRDPVRRDGALHVVAIGRLVEKKGFGVLLDAVAAVHAAGTDVRVTLAGAGELHDELAGRASSLGLDDVVRMPGPVSQDEVSALLEEADVFAAPCVVGADGNADGLPTVLLEAMAVGVPCVSTSVTGIPEVVVDGRTGILCPPGDAGALAAALRRMAEGEVDAAPLARAARALVESRHDSRSLAARHAVLTASATGATTRTTTREEAA
ncbi:glycosyltransferase family 4 protein [Microbacterium betulae]|uniref:Glycosyltransferase family 4 protein n=1 Tax=Microbacterium betulae TaxID=2981139 RepID=A0AA97FGD1_9MICO|nr:glycosyltransferase family 4 protein [Microbacterium sp. AB]WOF21770.1 glycosyltransferase family 4 protein [Microbacterium sp. AB]